MQKLSSTATLTVTVTDANDNRPVFEQESYSFSVPETAPANQLIGVITAKDLDSGRFGTHGIRYSLTGAGSELFRVNDNGAITVAECRHPQTADSVQQHRKKRDMTMETEKPPTNAKKVNLTIVGETGFIDVNDDDDTTASTTELYYPYANVEEVTFRPFFSANDDYMVMSEDSDEETTTAHETVLEIDENHNNNQHRQQQQQHHHQQQHAHELNTIGVQQHTQTTNAMEPSTTVAKATESHNHTDGPGHAPCLDYETQPVYFLTYKVCHFRTFIL